MTALKLENAMLTELANKQLTAQRGDYYWEFHSTAGSTTCEGTIWFNTPCNAPPMVLLSVSVMDSAVWTNVRWRVDSENVTVTQFTIKFTTWWDTIVYGARIEWIVDYSCCCGQGFLQWAKHSQYIAGKPHPQSAHCSATIAWLKAT